MSISKAASFHNTSDDFYCPKCGTPLLPQAAFCSSCGERLDNGKASSSLLHNEQDITIRYRITSLVRRRPYVNLYFALDNQRSRQGQQRMVAIRDIDITSLPYEARAQAIKLIQQEYDSLRLWQIPHVLPMVDLRYCKGHLYAVSGYPLTTSSLSSTGITGNSKVLTGNLLRLYTLQDFLQSGQGLPSEQQALKWIWYLCQALEGLHRHQIVIAELDPYTIILNENSDRAQPALMISWLPPQLRQLLPMSQASTTSMSYFSAPEALQGKAEPRSDIYSLGAILYLLLTGSPPDESALRTRGRLRIPHELNSRISPHVNECVVQALSIEPSERFQSARAMAEALYNPRYRRPHTQKLNRRDNEVTNTPAATENDVETVRIVPLSQKHQARWQAYRSQATKQDQIPQRPLTPRPTSEPQEVEVIEAEWHQDAIPPLSTPSSATPAIDAKIEDQAAIPGEQVSEEESKESQQTSLQSEAPSPAPQMSQNTSMPAWNQRITGELPAIASDWLKKNHTKQAPTRSLVDAEDILSQNEATITWFKQLQHIILGQQRQAIMAAAIVESPLRVQPNQIFLLRLHIMGRDEPMLPASAK